MFDGKAFGEEIVGIVRDYLEREVAPLKAENDVLKARLAALEDRPAPEIDLTGVEKLIQAEIDKLPTPQEIDTDELLAPVKAESENLQARIAALEERPAPEKGDPGEKGADGSDGADGRDGEDGTSVTIEDVAPLIAEQVARAAAEIPVPKDGIDGKDGRDGSAGKDGSDGRGVKDLLIDREGQLVATMDDGEMRVLGPVIGKDGEPGKDGRDGFGFDDMDACVLDDDRTIEFRFRRGEAEKAFTFKWPTVVDRGVYKAGNEYEAGDGVTWGGSFWIAQRSTNLKPDSTDSGWRMAVRKGRDGKDAKGDGK